VTRRPGPPPAIPGYTPGELIGSGGFADVFVYQQEMGQRDVAVKVLDDRLSDESSSTQFHSEANLMARLSTHPYIVTIHLAGIADDGRPYLVMEYCSRDDLAKRVRSENLSVAEAVRIGIRIAGAIETAHRAGILHRDIKPANILTTDYGNPALTDFGIAAAIHDTAGIEGLSVPWSPPEALLDPENTTVASDVYSLAATIWHLLARRAPFALPGGPNGTNDQVHRIRNTPVPPMNRPDVPPGLERLLTAALAKRPEERPASVLELARSLQAVEHAAGYDRTDVDILERAGPRNRRPEVDADETGTRVHGVVGPEAEVTGPRAPRDEPVEETEAGGTVITLLPDRVPAQNQLDTRTTNRVPLHPPEPVAEDTIHLPPKAAEPEDPQAQAPAEPPAGRWRTPLYALAGLLVAGGLAAAVVVGTRGGPTPPPDPTPTVAPAEDDAVIDVVPSPTALAGERRPDGSIVFTWQTPGAVDGDTWVVRRADPGVPDAPEPVAEPTFTVTGVPAGERACVAVVVVRAGRTSAEPLEGCVD
jgi:serine/threonine protein kinase